MKQYAVVDVETTGGSAGRHRIIEVGVVLLSETEIEGAWGQLIHVDAPIPSNIQRLTGIQQKDLINQPSFEKIAPYLHNLLRDRIFVAHNVNFDYSFIVEEFKRIGITYEAERICSVRYARKIIPGLRSYGLDALANHYHLHNEARHRALGDAKVTALIFKDLLQRDNDKSAFNKTLMRNQKRLQLPLHLDEEDIETLPSQTGVYYMKDQKGVPIYIGKSKNIKDRIQTHFSSDLKRSKTQHLIREVYKIDYQLCGSELIALLLEDLEIRHYWPQYNKAQKTTKQLFGLFHFKNQKGNLQFRITRISKGQQPLKRFQTYLEGMDWLIACAKEKGLDLEACGALPDDAFTTAHHDENGEAFVEALKELQGDYVYITTGREVGEVGFVWIINGHFRALGWMPADEIVAPEQLKKYAKHYGEGAYCDRLIEAYAPQHAKNKVVLENTELLIPKGNTLSLF